MPEISKVSLNPHLINVKVLQVLMVLVEQLVPLAQELVLLRL